MTQNVEADQPNAATGEEDRSDTAPEATESTVTQVDDASENPADSDDAAVDNTGSGAEVTEIASSTSDGIDVDLTQLSSTMVYSEVYNMMTQPDQYRGKKVKMDGSFAVYYDENSDKYYYACIIQDATACCSQGIEFILADERKFPDEYPEVGGEISVEGVFDTYMEGESMYCTLKDAELL
jgi:hypothetical protein